MKRLFGQFAPSPTDTRRVRRLVKARNWVWATLAVCLVTGVVCDLLVPASWKGGKIVSGGSGPYGMVMDRSSGALHDVNSSVTAWVETFLGVNVGTRVEVKVFETPVPLRDSRDPASMVARTQLMADIRDACERRCEAVGDPGAAALFDKALAANTPTVRNGTTTTGGEVAVTYPWRYPVACLRAAAWGGMCVMMTFGLAGPLVLEFLIKRARKAGATGKCGECGYDLAGLEAGRACPECGAGANGQMAKGPNQDRSNEARGCSSGRE